MTSIKIALVSALVLLAGCTPQPPAATSAPAPTVDTGAIVDQAVRTVEAELTQAAFANPSPTSPATATPSPTATPAPTEDVEVATLQPEPSATGTQAKTATLLYVTTYPENKREFIPNEKFGLAIGFRNDSEVTWTAAYKLAMVSYTGVFTAQPEASLGKDIAPGEKAEFDLWGFGSETLGQHTWVFQLYNDRGIPVPGGYAAFTYTAK